MTEIGLGICIHLEPCQVSLHETKFIYRVSFNNHLALWWWVTWRCLWYDQSKRIAQSQLHHNRLGAEPLVTMRLSGGSDPCSEHLQKCLLFVPYWDCISIARDVVPSLNVNFLIDNNRQIDITNYNNWGPTRPLSSGYFVWIPSDHTSTRISSVAMTVEVV